MAILLRHKVQNQMQNISSYDQIFDDHYFRYSFFSGKKIERTANLFIQTTKSERNIHVCVFPKNSASGYLEVKDELAEVLRAEKGDNSGFCVIAYADPENNTKFRTSNTNLFKPGDYFAVCNNDGIIVFGVVKSISGDEITAEVSNSSYKAEGAIFISKLLFIGEEISQEPFTLRASLSLDFFQKINGIFEFRVVGVGDNGA